jgi:hypothetical protein
MRIRFLAAPLIVAAAMTAFPQTRDAAPLSYGTASWDADSLGTHRAVLEVPRTADAVRALIPWRRRDPHAETRGAWIVDAATGARVENVHWLQHNGESGDVVFQPPTVPGRYYVYYLLYRARASRNYPRGIYLPFEEHPSPAWMEKHALNRTPLPPFPAARLIRLESIDQFNSFYPMEVAATRREMAELSRRSAGADYLLFPEPRSHPIAMTEALPAHWARDGERRSFSLSAGRGEYLSFQVGVVALRESLEILSASLSPLSGGKSTGFSASSFTCFNTEGRDWQGRQFARSIRVPQGHVQALWMGLQVLPETPPGRYTGTLRINVAGKKERPLRFNLTVSGEDVAAAGDDDPSRLSRLRWLNSQAAADDSLIRPFTPVTVAGQTLSILGRSLELSGAGLPQQITSTFTPEVTSVQGPGRKLLRAPALFNVISPDGRPIPVRWSGVTFGTCAPGIARWRATGDGASFGLEVDGQLECDGYADFRVTLRPHDVLALRDVRLDVPMDDSVARYMMGMGVRGGFRPERFSWSWDRTRNQDALWLGDVNAGFQISFRDTNYERPLNTNFYLSRPLNLPPGWYNAGAGKVSFAPHGDTLLLSAAGGAREVRPEAPVHFFFSLLLTPFKPLDTDAQWSTRYYHKYDSLAAIVKTGANTVNVHHATPINPYINYPFLRPAAMKAYVDSAHAMNLRVKIYYTVRELANRAPELFALRSLGDEVLATGPGGGFSWLQEHLDSTYIAGWFVPELKDAALVTSGVSRWHNYYVEGLAWLVKNVGIDGLYIDDVAFDRTTMKRVRKVLDRGRPDALIDLHSANQFNPRDGFASSANLYLEHFPFLNRLWFGEYFDYDSAPDYWLVEISGIPFGLMGEMLEKGGNPWRGIVYGMTSRLPWAGDPRPVWRLLDQFTMQGSRMFGYWSPSSPVTTGNPLLLATTYVREGKSALIALASWAPADTSCRLTIDWQALGLNPARAHLRVPASDGFQAAALYRPEDSVRVEKGKGLLLIVEERP